MATPLAPTEYPGRTWEGKGSRVVRAAGALRLTFLDHRSVPAVVAASALFLIGFATVSRAQTTLETLERPSGERVEGMLEGDIRSGFRFRVRATGELIPVEAGATLQASGSGADALAGLPPFHVLVGESLRLSGQIRSISESRVKVKVSWQDEEITLPRPGVQSVLQRPGEARLLADGFDRLDASRWLVEGKASIAGDPSLSEKSSLRLAATGASVKHRLTEPLAAGRIELAFFDEGSVVAGPQWFAELGFESPSGPLIIKVDLGWSEESLAVHCPRGPSLAVQRLARTRGWHRLMVRFGPTQTEISVDGQELAHGKSLDGQLASIRLASLPSSTAAPKELAGYVDDLQIIRFAEPANSFEVDITQDEARLVTGDQLFGEVRKADGERVVMAIEGKSVDLSWNEVAGLFFRRVPAQGAATDGLLARIEWRAAAGDDPADLDFAEGAIVAAGGEAITMATPYSGLLRISRSRIRKIAIFGEGRRIVIDPASHHLGDEPSRRPPLLDPPIQEGDQLERTFELADVPDAQAQALLVMDVVGVVGEDNDTYHSAAVRKGELRTWVFVNGQRIDYLNRYVKTQQTPERVAIPIPAGLLHAAKNTLRLELTAVGSQAERLDDFGLLGIALDFRRKPKAASVPSP